jgi:phage terminase large subunit
VLEPMSEELGRTIKVDNRGHFELFGNHVHCFGADKADSYKSMTGMTAHGWYGNEVSLQHANTIQEAFNRCSGEDAFVIWDTNPDFPEHPIKVNFIDRSGEKLSSGKERVRSYHFVLDDNEFLPAEYIENLKRSTPAGMWYDRAIKGLWVAAEGLVYEHFDREMHIVKPFAVPDSWTKVRGVDFGYANPFVCLWGAVDHDGRLYITDEHYKANTLIKDHVTEIGKRRGRYSWTVSDHDAQERAELHSLGVPTVAADKDIEHGLQKVAERLVVQGDGYPRLMVFANCRNLIREFGLYRWEEQKDGRAAKEEPHKENDHAMDALRYMVMQLDRHRVVLENISL